MNGNYLLKSVINAYSTARRTRDLELLGTHRPDGLRPGASVAFVAAPYGFGPSSKAIAISSYLPRAIARIFFGDGPSLEMARSSNEFSACFRLDFATPTDHVAETLSPYGAVIFVNSTRFLRAASDVVGPVTFVDTLAWLRCHPLATLPAGTTHYAQAFFDHPLPADLMAAANVQVTGAIVPAALTAMRARKRSAHSPIVHCGGLCSPVMCEDADVSFVENVINTLRSTGAPARLILPKHLHREFAGRVPPRIALINCSSVTVREHLADSPFALTTSGIEFTYECVLLGVPTLFLPAFNGSQHFQLAYHNRKFTGSIPFSFRDAPHLRAAALDDATATLQTEGIAGAWSRQFGELREHLTRIMRDNPAEGALRTLRDKQAIAMRAVGADGAQAIAAHILRELKAKDPYKCMSHSI